MSEKDADRLLFWTCEGKEAAGQDAKPEGAAIGKAEEPESEEDASTSKAWAAHKSDDGQVVLLVFTLMPKGKDSIALSTLIHVLACKCKLSEHYCKKTQVEYGLA